MLQTGRRGHLDMVQIVRKSSQRQDEKPGNGDGIRVIYGRMV